ncbi:hypothetical protein [Corynebacterium sp.]|uniref:hypothetical protein n=1 Tax=Corynebacterium sp. TaxID=1720 RepID=UPI0028AE0F8D|nr:hypothetical protein [Corynebacterium sp.]
MRTTPAPGTTPLSARDRWRYVNGTDAALRLAAGWAAGTTAPAMSDARLGRVATLMSTSTPLEVAA